MEEIFNRIMELLKKHDIIVSYYKSIKTSSIYIKLDYGVANGIRIADHRGKHKYRYRYNVMIDLEKNHLDTDRGFKRYYFKPSDINKLILQIIMDKQSKLCSYGLKNYQKYMQEEKVNEVNKRFKEVG
jgi:hypothetical protein